MSIAERFITVRKLRKEMMNNKNTLTSDEKKLYDIYTEVSTENDRMLLRTVEGLRETALINDHFRAGLAAIASRDENFNKAFMFIAIFSKYNKKKKEVIIKNIYTGNMYIADHCFMKIQFKEDITKDINPGDLIIFNAIIYNYISNNKTNYGLIYVGGLQKFIPDYKSIDLKLNKSREEECNMDKLVLSLKLVTLDSGLPERFFETFILSILTMKQCEIDLIINKPWYHFIKEEFNYLMKRAIGYCFVYINSGNVNFLQLQGLLVLDFATTYNSGSKIDFVKSIKSNSLKIDKNYELLLSESIETNDEVKNYIIDEFNNIINKIFS